MERKIERIALVIATVLLVLLIPSWIGLQKDKKELISLNEVANEKIEVWKDKDGLNRGKIEVLQTQNTKDFLKFKTSDSLIMELQSEVKSMKKYLKNGGNVTIIQGETKYDTIYKSITPTEYKDIFSTFILDSVNNKWISSKFGFKLDTLSNGNVFIDSTDFSLKVKNQYSLTVGVEKTGFLGLGKGKPFAEIKNYNPYTETTNMKTYQVSTPKPKRFGIGINIGYGMTLIDKSVKVGPQVGIGGTYNFINF